jgi:hypothetical protein
VPDGEHPELHGRSASGATLHEQWRALNLLDRNVASYKFALAKALLTLKPTADAVVSLDELARLFALAVCRHLKLTCVASLSPHCLRHRSWTRFNCLGFSE